MLIGLDLSQKNGSLCWSSIPNLMLNFVYLKASEGLFKEDTFYSSNRQKAKDIGLLVGTYHWLDPKLNCKSQAEKFVQKIGSLQGELSPAVVLDTYHSSLPEMDKNVLTFLETVSALSGRLPIIYTSAVYWKQYLPKAEWGCKYKLWVDQPGLLFPDQLFPWAGWTFWQQSYQNFMPGLANQVGINWFNGSKKDLFQLAN